MKIFRKKRRSRISIRTALIAAFATLSSVIVLLMGGYINHVASVCFIDMAYEYNEQLTGQVKENLDAQFEGINETLLRFARDRKLQYVVSDEQDIGDYERYQAYKNVQLSMNSLLDTQKDIRYLFVFSDNGDVYTNDNHHTPNKTSPFLKELLNTYKDAEYMTVHYYPLTEPDYYTNSSGYDMPGQEIPISLVIRDTTKYDTTNLGVILASLSTEHIDSILEELRHSGMTAFIIDENDVIYYSSDSSVIGTGVAAYLDSRDMRALENGQVFDSRGKLINLASARPLGINNWRLVVVSDMVALKEQLHFIKIIICFVTLLTIVLVMGVSSIVAVKMTKPLTVLADEMEHRDDISGENLQKKQLFREIATLYDSYNEMNKRIETLMEQVYYEKLRQKDAQYEALQSKINPHFLYNTLQTIHSLAVLERSEDVDDVTVALGDMLGYLVYEKDSEVRLEQELDYIESYIKIQKVRYNDSFSVTVNVTREAKACVMHKLLVQPIVENAINHGLEDKEGGLLELNAWVSEGVLQIIVQDNGKGMDGETLKRLLGHIRSKNRNSRHKSIGLSNIQERVILKYGSEYGLSVRSILHEGTMVCLRLPAVREEDREEQGNG